MEREGVTRGVVHHLNCEVCEQRFILLLVVGDLQQLCVGLLHDAVHRGLPGLEHLDARLIQLLGELSAMSTAPTSATAK